MAKDDEPRVKDKEQPRRPRRKMKSKRRADRIEDVPHGPQKRGRPTS